MGRIFTFGCSFTDYRWPTWADIILYGNEGYNCAVTGGGFDSILYRLLEVDRKFKLTKEDKIIIVLTTPLRWDIIVNQSWSTHGQITSNPSFAKYENKLFSIDGLAYKSFNNLLLIQEFLERRNLNYVFGAITDLYKHLGNYFEDYNRVSETDELIKYVKSKVKIELIDFKNFISDPDTPWVTTKVYKDNKSEYHPRPLTHYRWVTDVLMKHMNIDLKITQDQLLEVEKHIDTLVYDDESFQIKDVFPEFFKKKLPIGLYIDSKSSSFILVQV